MVIDYKPQGICARQIQIEVEEGIVKDVKIVGGCDGNHKGIISLVKGMPQEDVIEKLSGITCGFRATSCPDQLAQALKSAIK